MENDNLNESLRYVLEDKNKISTFKLNLAKKEESDWDNLDEKRKYFEIERFKDDTQHRKTMSIWAAMVVSFWLLSVILILIGNNYSYKLNDNVLIALLTTTTINVLGLMIIVLNDFFKGGRKLK